jgi:hypothetical protein
MSVEWHFLIMLTEQLRPLKDPVAIQEVAARLIEEHLHASNYAHIDGDEFVIRYWSTLRNAGGVTTGGSVRAARDRANSQSLTAIEAPSGGE